MKIIFSLCTFLILFRFSTQFLTTSEETDSDDYETSSSDTSSSDTSSSDTSSSDTSSSDTSSSSSSSEESSGGENVAAKFGLAEMKKLNESQRRQFIQNFYVHLTAIAELQAEERLIVLAMRKHLPEIYSAKSNHSAAWKHLLHSILEGEKLLNKVLERRKIFTTAEKPCEVLKTFNSAWQKIEEKKHHEALSVFSKISEEIINLGKKLMPAEKDQEKIALFINDLINERIDKINEQSRELRENVEQMSNLKTANGTATTLSGWMLNAEDIANIKKQYEEMVNIIPKARHPEAAKLRDKLTKEGISIPYFCKTLAELQNMVGKFHGCILKNDEEGKEILKNSMAQPDYKKCWNIFQDCALNIIPADDQMKEAFRKQAEEFLFDSSKLFSKMMG